MTAQNTTLPGFPPDFIRSSGSTRRGWDVCETLTAFRQCCSMAFLPGLVWKARGMLFTLWRAKRHPLKRGKTTRGASCKVSATWFLNDGPAHRFRARRNGHHRNQARPRGTGGVGRRLRRSLRSRIARSAGHRSRRDDPWDATRTPRSGWRNNDVSSEPRSGSAVPRRYPPWRARSGRFRPPRRHGRFCAGDGSSLSPRRW